jgi:hypothetical protein
MANDAPDISTVAPDLVVPELSDGEPAPGLRVKDEVKGWNRRQVEGSPPGVYHVVYLPRDWKPGKRYPVIVEYMGNGGYTNDFGDTFGGQPGESKMGYGMSGGEGFIWVCLPFVNGSGQGIAARWWGWEGTCDPSSTVEYAKQAMPMVRERYGGDASRVVLAGFSRGAIACNAIGLHDEAISRFWRAFVPYSHYEGVREWPYAQSKGKVPLERLRRLGARPQFICHEDDGISLDRTKAYLESTRASGDFTFQSTGFRNHNDAWLLRPSSARDALRAWLKRVVS